MLASYSNGTKVVLTVETRAEREESEGGISIGGQDLDEGGEEETTTVSISRETERRRQRLLAIREGASRMSPATRPGGARARHTLTLLRCLFRACVSRADTDRQTERQPACLPALSEETAEGALFASDCQLCVLGYVLHQADERRIITYDLGKGERGLCAGIAIAMLATEHAILGS